MASRDDVKETDALHLVGGYTCFAGNSVRDFQAHSRHVTPGKNFQSSGAIGPWVATPDEVGDLAAEEIITRLNDEEMQRAPVSSMIYSIPRVLSYISSFTTLMPGDIVAMGTPAGVGMKRTPPVWLKAGDVLEVEVTGVGVPRNTVEAGSNRRNA